MKKLLILLYNMIYKNNIYFTKNKYNNEGFIFEGEYKNYKPHGQGIEKYPNGKICYKGNFEDGIYNGYGKMIFPNNDKFIGSFKNGIFHGEGIFMSLSGYCYQGQFKCGKIHGYGFYKFPNGYIYFTEWINGKLKKHLFNNIWYGI